MTCLPPTYPPLPRSRTAAEWPPPPELSDLLLRRAPRPPPPPLLAPLTIASTAILADWQFTRVVSDNGAMNSARG